MQFLGCLFRDLENLIGRVFVKNINYLLEGDKNNDFKESESCYKSAKFTNN